MKSYSLESLYEKHTHTKTLRGVTKNARSSVTIQIACRGLDPSYPHATSRLNHPDPGHCFSGVEHSDGVFLPEFKKEKEEKKGLFYETLF